MKKKPLTYLLVSCLVLGSCLTEEGKQEDDSPPYVTSVEAAPSILDCPPEDIIVYPILETIPPPWLPDGQPIDGWCGAPLKLSEEKLMFDAKGGVRCVATTGFLFARGRAELGCREEREADGRMFKKEICPWFTATKVDERTLHISVNPNETANERKMYINMSTGICGNSFEITQSAD